VRGGDDELPPTWFGLFAPTGTPEPIVVRLAAEVGRIVNDPGFRQRMFADRGVEPADMTRQEFARFISDHRKMAAQIMREPGLAQ
jgi:tripartite-type tricarboxylate transporter receptor subunit TctC